MKQCIKCGSYAINHHLHGRDGSRPDLCDVDYWRDVALEFESKLEAANERIRQIEKAIRFADDLISTLQVGEDEMEHRDWVRAVRDARIAYVSAKRSAKEAKP